MNIHKYFLLIISAGILLAGCSAEEIDETPVHVGTLHIARVYSGIPQSSSTRSNPDPEMYQDFGSDGNEIFVFADLSNQYDGKYYEINYSDLYASYAFSSSAWQSSTPAEVYEDELVYCASTPPDVPLDDLMPQRYSVGKDVRAGLFTASIDDNNPVIVLEHVYYQLCLYFQYREEYAFKNLDLSNGLTFTSYICTQGKYNMLYGGLYDIGESKDYNIELESTDHVYAPSDTVDGSMEPTLSLLMLPEVPTQHYEDPEDLDMVIKFTADDTANTETTFTATIPWTIFNCTNDKPHGGYRYKVLVQFGDGSAPTRSSEAGEVQATFLGIEPMD